MKDLVAKALKLIPGNSPDEKIPPNADHFTTQKLREMISLHDILSPIVNREPNDVSNNKTCMSSETVVKILEKQIIRKTNY